MRVEVDGDTGLLPLHVRGGTDQCLGSFVCRDDRLTDSWRAFVPLERAQKLHHSETERQYQLWRFLHGCGEGSLELSFDKSIPLENNIDLQNGVSFDKGCYLGQELIARAHHVGLVRKRLWPIWLGDEMAATVQTLKGANDVLQLACREDMTKFSVPHQGTYTLRDGDSPKECGRIIAVCNEYPRVALASLRVAHAKSGSIVATAAETNTTLRATPLTCAPWSQSVLDSLQ